MQPKRKWRKTPMQTAVSSAVSAPVLRETTSEALYGSPAPGIPLLVVDSPRCYAVIALQGAQLLEFKTKPDFTPLLWLSPKAVFAAGKAIRGGIPVCAPWFGPHPSEKTYPKHGFVRSELWALTQSEQSEDGITHLAFTYTPSDEAQKLYPFAFTLRLIMTLGEDIQLALEVTNHSTQPMPFSWALHSYHPVGDLASVQVEGLENVPFLDATDGYARKQEAAPIRFAGELDRVYEHVPAAQIIRGVPSITISGTDCPTCIVWNPGAALAATMPDVQDGFSEYICVERGAAQGNSWEIAVGSTQRASLRIALMS